MIVDRFNRFFRLVTLFVAALCVGRAVFLLKYHNTFSDAMPSDIARAFLYGLRFDLSTAAMITARRFDDARSTARARALAGAGA